MTTTKRINLEIQRTENPMATGWAIPIRIATGILSGMLGYLLVTESERVLGLLGPIAGLVFFEFDVTQSLILAVPIGLLLAFFTVKSSQWAKVGMHAIALTTLGAYVAYAFWINRGHPIGGYLPFLTALLIAPVTVFLYFFALKRIDHAYEGTRSPHET